MWEAKLRLLQMLLPSPPPLPLTLPNAPTKQSSALLFLNMDVKGSAVVVEEKEPPLPPELLLAVIEHLGRIELDVQEEEVEDEEEEEETK